MFRRILIPLDGSSQAEQVLPLATRLARTSGARLILLRVVRSRADFQTSSSTSLPSAAIQTMIEVERTEALSYLQRIVDAPEFANIQVKIHASSGPAAATIISAASELYAHLIILCRHGHSDSTRWQIGSTAEKIFHHAAIPVLLLPTGPAQRLWDRSPLRALAGLDGSANGEAALEGAASLLSYLSPHMRPELHCCQVIPHEEGEFPPSQHYLQYLAQRHERERPAPAITWSTIVDPDAASALLTLGEDENPYAFLALSTRGGGSNMNEMMGGVTARMLYYTTLPLFITAPAPQEMAMEPGAIIRNRRRLATHFV